MKSRDIAIALPFAVLTAACTSASVSAPDITKPPSLAIAPAALTAAHEAYLDGDAVGLGEHVRDVLLDSKSSDLVKENAYALLDKAFEANGGVLPSKFKVPDGYGDASYGIFRVATPNGVGYVAQFRIVARDGSHIKGLTVRHLPDGMLLDKATKKGTFTIRRDPALSAQHLEEVVLGTELADVPAADGVIAIRLELDDGTSTEGFVIAHGLAATRAPEILEPASSATVTDPNPRIRWTPFWPPGAPAFEQRRLVVHVFRDGAGPVAGPVNWEMAVAEGQPPDVRVGAGAGTPKTTLPPGDYWVSLTAGETRMFGPVEVVRASRVVRPFHVVR